MSVMDDLMCAYRALLSSDMTRWRRWRDRFGPDARAAEVPLLTAVFEEAVGLRFPGGAAYEDVIALVADLRAHDDRIADRLDPDVAERVVAAYLGLVAGRADVDEAGTVGAFMLVAWWIVREAALGDAELDALLDRARRAAERSAA